jgi:hypothetical protein
MRDGAGERASTGGNAESDHPGATRLRQRQIFNEPTNGSRTATFFFLARAATAMTVEAFSIQILT